MIDRPRKRRPVLVLLGAGTLLVLLLLALNIRPLLGSLVTRLALRTASREMPATEKWEERSESGVSSLARRYGGWFRRGFFSRDVVAERIPRHGVTPEARPAILVLGAYYQATEDLFQSATEEAIFEEFLRWLDPALRRSKSRELLVQLLVADYSLFPRDAQAGLPKQALAGLFFGRRQRDVISRQLGVDVDERFLSWRRRVVGAIRRRHWDAIVGDLEHSREKVRAGALLFLYHHPDEELFRELAYRALRDRSRWVRLAAAGTLALRGDGAGTLLLIDGLRHPRWEVRWWCGAGLAALERKPLTLFLAASAGVERDNWVRHQLREMIERLATLPGFPAPGLKPSSPARLLRASLPLSLLRLLAGASTSD